MSVGVVLLLTINWFVKDLTTLLNIFFYIMTREGGKELRSPLGQFIDVSKIPH